MLNDLPETRVCRQVLVRIVPLLFAMASFPACSEKSTTPALPDGGMGAGLRACNDGTGALDCCEESTVLDSCSHQELSCSSTCSFASPDTEQGVRGNFVCMDGQWQRGLGLFPCTRAITTSVHDAGMVDAAKGAQSVGFDASGARPGAILFFVPDDQTTNVSSSSLGLAVSSYSPSKRPEEQLSELANVLELVRWPSTERVPAEVSYDADAALYSTQVRLVPAATLAEGWYALRLNPPPAGASPWLLGSAAIEGLPTSRFHVGSQPLLKRIELCEKADSRTKLIVTFSESVSATNALSSSVVLTSAGAKVSCDVTETPPRGDYAGVELLCPSIANTAVLRIQFEGFVSTSGAALRTAAGTSPDYSIETGGLHESGGCRVYLPPPAPAR